MKIEELKNFESWCVEEFKKGNIRSPMHLSGSVNDEQEYNLIEIFKEIKENDWVFTTYRSHYHALLKGVPVEWLKNWVLQNKSIHVMNKEHKIVSSAHVGGILSQAVGVAMAIKRESKDEKVWCFVGDMTASLGIFNDCLKYSIYNELPITFIIEDNGFSTDTPTYQAWGSSKKQLDDLLLDIHKFGIGYVKYYSYKRMYAHYGSNKEGEPRHIIT